MFLSGQRQAPSSEGDKPDGISLVVAERLLVGVGFSSAFLPESAEFDQPRGRGFHLLKIRGQRYAGVSLSLLAKYRSRRDFYPGAPQKPTGKSE